MEIIAAKFEPLTYPDVKPLSLHAY